jgi:hypothetical protein
MRLEVPRIPPSGNEMRRKYRTIFAYRDLRLLWEHDLRYCTGHAMYIAQLKMQAEKHRKLRVEVTVFRPKMLDADNHMAGLKPVLDGLKQIGFIADDCADRIELVTHNVPGKRKFTVIEITPAL